jgi:hypothetical protein
MAWGPVFVALVLFSGYEFLHVKWQEFLYIDDEKIIPTWLHLASGLYLAGLGVGVLGLTVMAVLYVNPGFLARRDIPAVIRALAQLFSRRR